MKTLHKITGKILYFVTGKRSWRSLEYFDPSWAKRIQEMAKYIHPQNSVLDLGCGKMWLKNYLTQNTYYPVDYTDRGTGTIVCNFNKKEFPEIQADTAFVSGTLEYISDPQWFVSEISKHCRECIISYCLIEDYTDTAFRLKQAWANNFSRADILELFSKNGFNLLQENKNIPKNNIFYFSKIQS